jgi:hypothetical protein
MADNNTESQTGYLQINSENDPDEFSMIVELASLLGLKRATVLKLHLRETLPNRITELKANLTHINGSGQEKTEIGAVNG